MAIEPHGADTLRLKHVLAASGITDLPQLLAIRHTARADGLPEPWAASAAEVLAYTREQDAPTRLFPKDPPGVWLIFMEDGSHAGAHRSRFYTAYENHGEACDERTEARRFFRLSPSPLLTPMRNRLVVGWVAPRRWFRFGQPAGEFPVVEIADPHVITFVGYDKVRLSYQRLQAIVEDPHYSQWHSALKAVKGIYLISDTSTGKHYVGKADGAQGIFGRWEAYALNGHGWNKELVALPPGQCKYFVFSILRVFGSEATLGMVNEAESHYKKALLTRAPFGYNAN